MMHLHSSSGRISLSWISYICGLLTLSLLFALAANGCAGVHSPVDPAVSNPLGTVKTAASMPQTHLWGYYDVSIDIENRTVSVSENRQAAFTANVVNLINNKPASLGFKIKGINHGSDYIDIDIDVSITHPFPGLPQYHGYDVRGIFMGSGSASLGYNPDLIYPVHGADQYMLPNPVNGNGAPDGYTRWFNKPEFSGGGMPLFQYTQGKLASPAFDGNATLNPYRYFADGLGENGQLWDWLVAHPGIHGQFSSGATNARNYYLRFPTSMGVKYGYAIVANWSGLEPQYHPSNAPEAIACKIDDLSDLWFADPSQNGGNIILDMSLYNWNTQPGNIYIESTILNDPYKLDVDDMIPTGGGENYSTWHVEIPSDHISGMENQEYWIIAESADKDYTNDFGVNNLAGTDPLTAFFRYKHKIGNNVPKWLNLTSPNGGEVWTVGSNHNITWESGGIIASVKIEYSKDGFAGDINVISASTANDGIFEWQIPNDPSTTVRVRVSDASNASIYDISQNDFTIELIPSDCAGVHDSLKYEGTYQLNWSQVSYPSWLRSYDIASLKDGRVVVQGVSKGEPALMAFDVTQNGLVNGDVLMSGQWGSNIPNWLMSIDVCDVTGNIVFVIACDYGKMIVIDSTGKYVASFPSTSDVFAAVDTDWEGGIWTVEYNLNSDPTPMGIEAYLEHYEWTGTTYVHNPAHSVDITKDLELNPIKVCEIGIVFTAKRLILLEHSSYPWKGNMYNYDLSGGMPVLMPELTQNNFLSSPLSESQIGHWRFAFDIEIDHTDPLYESCRIVLGRRSGSGWNDGSYFTRYDTDMNMLGEYHVPGTSENDHLLEAFTLNKNPDDPDGIYLTIHEGWLSHKDMDRFEVYGMPTGW